MSYNIPEEVKKAIIFNNMIRKIKISILELFTNGRESKLE